jgi:hypothetical protein
MLLRSAEHWPFGMKKPRYNHLSDADEESSSDMSSEDSDDVINLEIEGQTASEESSFKMSESES